MFAFPSWVAANQRAGLVSMQGSEVDVEDVKKVYSLFLDEHRSTVFLQVS